MFFDIAHDHYYVLAAIDQFLDALLPHTVRQVESGRP